MAIGYPNSELEKSRRDLAGGSSMGLVCSEAKLQVIWEISYCHSTLPLRMEADGQGKLKIAVVMDPTKVDPI